MRPQYVNDLLQALDPSRVIMDLNGVISDAFLGFDKPHVIGKSFAAEMRAIAAEGKQVVVYINSDGGNVDEGWAIVQAIRDTGADTHVVGRATSMAAVIALFGKRRTANQFARLQFHGATSQHKEIEQTVNDQMKEVLSEVTNLSKSRIDKILAKRGNDVEIFTAKDAEKSGILNEVIPNRSEMDIAAVASEELYKAYASLSNHKTKNPMTKVNAILKLNADASDEAQVEAINAIEARASNAEGKVETLTAELKTAKEKITAFEAEKAEAAKAEAKSFIDNAVEQGVISEESKDKWVTLAEGDFEGTKELIGSIKGSENPQSATAGIKPEAAASSKTSYSPEEGNKLYMDEEKFAKLTDDQKLAAVEANLEFMGQKQTN